MLIQKSQLKQIARRITPLRKAYYAAFPTPVCNLCGHARFNDMKKRIAVRCASCGSFERTRIFKLFADKYGIFKSGMRVLHLAPENGLGAYVRSAVGKHYEAADYSPELYPHCPDIRKIDLCAPLDGFEKNAYDVVLHSHVLEHIPCDWRLALGRLNALLKPGGIHLCCIPIMSGRYDEDFRQLPPQEAIRRFGQHDHVRRFGREDIHETLGKAVPLPQSYDLTKEFSARTLRKHNIPQQGWRGFTPSSVLMWRKEDCSCDRLP